MDGAGNLLIAKGRDHPFNLPPVAEPDDIAEVTARFRTRRRFEAGIVAERFNQQGGVGQCGATGDEGRVHGRCTNPAPLSSRVTDAVNNSSTMIGWHKSGHLPMPPP
jgi:hypothetical protein